MERREVIRAMSAAAALSFLPRNARAVWRLVDLRTATEPLAALTPGQGALVNAIADTIIPRTDTPGASDVNVLGWVDVVVAEYYSDDEKATFLAGLDAIDAAAKARGGATVTGMKQNERDEFVGTLEKLTNRREEPSRTYWRLKGLVIHGYFTSEKVQKQVLKTEVMPGRFVGDAPHVVKS
ncbi:MAG TPA: gluconate 2-dehydrogenase subunit 3 family protein [Gemmatimonadaceae bacterium]|nr:gluconate 2-dehydrogenase subunit 3 family protein [Gemmatimonadaceae bacterium]